MPNTMVLLIISEIPKGYTLAYSFDSELCLDEIKSIMTVPWITNVFSKFHDYLIHSPPYLVTPR